MLGATRTVLRSLRHLAPCQSLRSAGAASPPVRSLVAARPASRQTLPKLSVSCLQTQAVAQGAQTAERVGSAVEGASLESGLQSSPNGQTAAPQQRQQASRNDVNMTSPTMQEVEQHLGPFTATPTLAPPPPLVVVISGPSGVGKDAVIDRLRQRRPELHFVITATSRPMRAGEVHGKDYFFVTREEFETWLAAGELLEHALVYGDYKGIPRQQVEEALANQTDVVLRIDVQGAASVRVMMPEAISIFLAADSEQKLVQRLVARKTENMETILSRVSTARAEAVRMQEFDYVVVNEEGRLEETVERIEGILRAEKARVTRCLPART
mmetsp:Transcript_11246/g.33766  ORF Transcript_11246/g.33766 Transcript_11246/m.33766 type:complete len:326 (+) Transcript_11246:76-1053(+)